MPSLHILLIIVQYISYLSSQIILYNNNKGRRGEAMMIPLIEARHCKTKGCPSAAPQLTLPFYFYKMVHPFCDFLFFRFCFGGWRTTLIAASNTALMFCTVQSNTPPITNPTLQLAFFTTRRQLGDALFLPAVFLSCTRCRLSRQLPSSALHPTINTEMRSLSCPLMPGSSQTEAYAIYFLKKKQKQLKLAST